MTVLFQSLVCWKNFAWTEESNNEDTNVNSRYGYYREKEIFKSKFIIQNSNNNVKQVRFQKLIKTFRICCKHFQRFRCIFRMHIWLARFDQNEKVDLCKLFWNMPHIVSFSITWYFKTLGFLCFLENRKNKYRKAAIFPIFCHFVQKFVNMKIGRDLWCFLN
jgi:hypothetical protein